MVYIERSITPYVQKAEKNFKAVLITGARQAGKSTLLKKLFPNRKYITFDDPFIEEQAIRNAGMFMTLNQPPVTFDEVQRVPDLFRYIKIECDKRDEYGLYCLSGSQPFRLMQNVSESLSGRISIVELTGLSLREIQRDTFDKPFLPTMDYVMERQKTARQPENIWQIIHRGSFPELYQNPDLDWQQFYASYIKTYLERDVRELSAVQNLDVFRRFMVAVAARTGQMVNYANIADEVGRDAATIRNWFSILEASGIIYLLEPYTPSVLKRAIKTPKVYFRDKTFVISEILKSYSNQGIDYRYCVSYYRGKDKKRIRRDGKEIEVEGEIDFIIEENGVLYPIEIKKNTSETAYAASAFQVLDKVEDKKRGMGAVISMCPAPGMLRENVLELPVWFV